MDHSICLMDSMNPSQPLRYKIRQREDGKFRFFILKEGLPFLWIHQARSQPEILICQSSPQLWDCAGGISSGSGQLFCSSYSRDTFYLKIFLNAFATPENQDRLKVKEILWNSIILNLWNYFSVLIPNVRYKRRYELVWTCWTLAKTILSQTGYF